VGQHVAATIVGAGPAPDATPIPFPGAIDADGHIIEPPDLWEQYLEGSFRDRPICIRKNDDGVEYFEVDGRPSTFGPPGSLGKEMMGELGAPPGRTYAEHIPYGASDPGERLALLDRWNLERVVLYPTFQLCWEVDIEDPETTYAYIRAYNRWIVDFCAGSGGRLVPTAHLSLVDVDAAVAELERAVEAGCRGAFLTPFTHTRRPHGHPDHDRLWAKAQELDVPVGLHPTIEPPAFSPHTRFDYDDLPSLPWYMVVQAQQRTQQAFLTFFSFKTFDRFPRLKIGVLESQAGWIGSLLDRMDALAETKHGRALGLRELPSTYFRRQCFISADPDETSAPLIMEHVGADRFVWASDFPHSDHTPDWTAAVGRMAESLSAPARARVLGQNATELYGLG
jgi:predicted TIM-barrel fold metal-dependent hydrolase